MRSTSVVGRTAALAAIALAAAAVAFLLLRGGPNPYHVNLLFQNAAQLVKGNLIQVSGRPVGKIEDITLTPDGQADVRAAIDADFAPLRRGTKAIIRVPSLSGIANRYIDLQLPPATNPAIPDNGTIDQSYTTTAVDLDQIFNVFGPRERKALQGVIKGFAQLYSGREKEANAGLVYLNPSLAATSRLMREIDFDEPGLRGFINQTANLVTDINERRTDLAALIQNLAATTGAIGRRSDELQSAISQLPDFMRRSNTTFVNLRSTLDDLDPLVNESKPVAKKLRPFLAQLRPLARDARPTLNDLSTLISQPGSDNDLIEATQSNIRVRNATVRHVHANGKRRDGAFQASINALQGATPELSYAKPYAVDLEGWFDDFSHSGYYDALGSVGRVALNVNAFAIVNGAIGPAPGCAFGPVICTLPLPLLQRGIPANSLAPGVPPVNISGIPGILDTVANQGAQFNQDNRCPGSSERNWDGSNPFIPPALKPDQPGGCDPTQVPRGP